MSTPNSRLAQSTPNPPPLPFRPALRVAIVDDDRRYRQSLAVLLDGTPGFQCVGAWASAEEALEQLPVCRPEVALIDIGLPRMSGIECAGRLRRLLPDTEIIIITVYEDTERILDSLRAGAAGYLAKQATPAEILDAIQDVHRGGSPMSSHIARRLIEVFRAMGPPPPQTESLSPREQEVLGLLAKGYRYREIAEALHISVLTVRTHLRHIYEKLHVRSCTEAVVKYLGGQT
ncbi:MAG TPA: response regulator transcription factor [Verrucomicrobiae bacterium]